MMMDDGLENEDDNTLYELFDDAANRLGGRLVRLAEKAYAKGDATAEREWSREHKAVTHAQTGIMADDRESQIRCIRAWRARRRELGALL